MLVADYFFFSVLNETASRIATLRMRSGLRFMTRAASSRDFAALESSLMAAENCCIVAYDVSRMPWCMRMDWVLFR